MRPSSISTLRTTMRWLTLTDARAMPRRGGKMSCPLIDCLTEYCDEHEAFHGSEAEELRKAVEAVINDLSVTSDDNVSVDELLEIPAIVAEKLQEMLDRVD